MKLKVLDACERFNTHVVKHVYSAERKKYRSASKPLKEIYTNAKRIKKLTLAAGASSEQRQDKSEGETIIDKFEEQADKTVDSITGRKKVKQAAASRIKDTYVSEDFPNGVSTSYRVSLGHAGEKIGEETQKSTGAIRQGTRNLHHGTHSKLDYHKKVEHFIKSKSKRTGVATKKLTFRKKAPSKAMRFVGSKFVGIAAVFLVLIIVMVTIIGALMSAFVISWNDPFAAAPPISVAEACRRKKDSYESQIVEASAALIDDLGDGYSYPVVLNKDIHWREFISLYLAYTSDKEMQDPNTRFKVAGTDYHYFETVFNECNKISIKYNKTYEFDYPFDIYYSYGDEIEDYGVFQFTSGVLVLCYHPTPEVVANELNFNENERILLEQLLNDSQYDDYFKSLIQVIESGSGTPIVDVAALQIDSGYEKFCSWFNDGGGRFEWCAAFVSWCANECGYIDAQIIPKDASCRGMYDWFNSGYYSGSFVYTYKDPTAKERITPEPGWLIIWERDDDHSMLSHIGIVESYDPSTGTFTTIEGNTTGDKVKRNPRSWDDTIWGFCVPNYPKDNENTENKLQEYIRKALGVSSSWEPFSSNNQSIEDGLNNNPAPSIYVEIANEIIGILESGEEIPDEVYEQYIEWNELGCYQEYKERNGE